MSAVAAMLADGRLHLQHGPIDCLCRAWGEPAAVRLAYDRAIELFGPLLGTLCAELPALRTPLPSPRPSGHVAGAMHDACAPFADRFITPMAAVAGAVADHILAAITSVADVPRATVNNGGDIAFHLAHGHTLRCGLVTDLAAPAIDGVFELRSDLRSRGLATSGRACKQRGGRSFSFGIADAVSVLARTAAQADAAATMIANAVDLPLHPKIVRCPAADIDPDSDLGTRLITLDVGALSTSEIHRALDAGRGRADALRAAGLIECAVLALRGATVTSGLSTRALETA